MSSTTFMTAAFIQELKGRIIILEPKGIKCDLDQIQYEFSPAEGDWVSLVTDGRICKNYLSKQHNLDIKLLKPLNCRTYEGRVSHISEDCTMGIVNHSIVFKKEVCNGGIMPEMNDQVVVYAIDSTQGALVWRAVHLIIIESGSRFNDEFREEKLFGSKHGVQLSPMCDNKCLKIGQQTTYKIKIENDGTEAQVLLAVEFINSKTISRVMKLVTRISEPIVIQSGSHCELEVLATARSIGHYFEVMIFYFKNNWRIGCLLDINVNGCDRGQNNLIISECFHLASEHVEYIDAMNQQTDPQIPPFSSAIVGESMCMSISMVISPSNFVIQPAQYVEELEKMTQDMKTFYGTIRPVVDIGKIQKGNIFAVQNDDEEWRRGLITGISIDTGEVSLKCIDYGDIIDVNFKNIYVLMSRFCKLPALAVQAELAGIAPIGSDWKLMDCLRFRELLPPKTNVFGVIVHVSHHNIISTVLYNTSLTPAVDIGAMLVNEGRATDITVG